MKKKIIFINQETGPLLIDIINVFSNQNFKIILYTGNVIETYANLNHSVKIRKCITYKKNNNFMRLLTWFAFFIQSFFYLCFDSTKDVIIYYSSNPPIIYFLNLIFKSVSFIHIYDVYPNALLAHPLISKKSVIYKSYSYLNKKSFLKSKSLFTPSYGMREMLKEYCNIEKINVVSWWADTDFISPIPKSKNIFLQKNNLLDQFVIMYSGNLGATHNIEKLLNLAIELKESDDIKIIIIGDGSKKTLVDDFQQQNNLKNLMILPFQSVNMLPYSLTAPDISIVLDSFSSDNNDSTASIPSKLFYIMAAGTVVYAEADKKSELNRIINKYDIGLCDETKNIEKFKSFILECKTNTNYFDRMKKNSRKASFNFSKKNANLIFNKIEKFKI